MVSDLKKSIGGSTDLVQKRHGSPDLHTPIDLMSSARFAERADPQVTLFILTVSPRVQSNCQLCLNALLQTT